MKKDNTTGLSNLFEKYQSNVFPAMLNVLASDLGVTSDAIQKIGIGFNPSKQAWVFPERNADGDIVGLVQRLLDGKKFMVKGSKRGLTYVLNQEHYTRKDGYVSGKHNWKRVSREIPCPICGKPDWCLVSASNPNNPGAVLCSRVAKGSAKEIQGSGYLHICNRQGEISDGNKGTIGDSDKPVVVVEGQSDVAAAIDLGFVAIGKPSAKGGLDILPDLLAGREVIVIGENDAGAGSEGMEATFLALQDRCKSIVKVMPPSGFKDLRAWKNGADLNSDSLLKWAEENGATSKDSNVFDNDMAPDIAELWLYTKKSIAGMPILRNYRGQWVEYSDGRYGSIDPEVVRGQVYEYLDGKYYQKLGNKGQVSIEPYKASRSKVSDILDALNRWCPITEDPPVWLKDSNDYPDPVDLIAFRNGILDVNQYLKGNIKLYEASPKLFTFNVLPYDFNPDLSSDLWDSLIEDIFDGDSERIKLLSQWFGYNLVPDMSYEKMMLFTGRPRSGKSTMIDALAAMLGKEQCCSISFQSLCGSFGYEPLIGKLAALIGDAKVPNRNEADAALEKILQITGGDPVSVNRKHIRVLSNTYLKCRFTVAMNDLPAFSDHARALEPRLNIIHFTKSYLGKEDRTIKRRLKTDAQEGKLVNFALAGLKSLREEKKFVEPSSSISLFSQLRGLSAPVFIFVEDCCEIHDPYEKGCEHGNHVRKQDLYEVWQHWCGEQGYKPGTRESFSRQLFSAFPTVDTKRRMVGRDRERIFINITLQEWVYRKYLGKP